MVVHPKWGGVKSQKPCEKEGEPGFLNISQAPFVNARQNEP